MKDNEYKVWAAGIAQLTATQKKDLLRRLKQFGVEEQQGEEKEKVSSDAEDWLLNHLLEDMRRAGFGVDRRFRYTKSFSDYQKNRDQVLSDIQKLVPKKIHSREMEAMARLVSKTLLSYCLEKYGQDIPMSCVLRNVPNWRVAFEQAFPGYVNGGLLPLLLTKL